MPAILSALRRTFPGVFDSQNQSLRYNSSPFSSSAIQKMVTHEVTYMPRAANSDDAIELVSRGNGSGPKNSW